MSNLEEDIICLKKEVVWQITLLKFPYFNGNSCKEAKENQIIK